MIFLLLCWKHLSTRAIPFSLVIAALSWGSFHIHSPATSIQLNGPLRCKPPRYRSASWRNWTRIGRPEIESSPWARPRKHHPRIRAGKGKANGKQIHPYLRTPLVAGWVQEKQMKAQAEARRKINIFARRNRPKAKVLFLRSAWEAGRMASFLALVRGMLPVVPAAHRSG